MLFRKCGCLVAHGKYIFRKLFKVDQENEPLTTEMVWSSNFHFKPFPGQTRRERGKEKERVRAWEEARSRLRRRRRSPDRHFRVRRSHATVRQSRGSPDRTLQSDDRTLQSDDWSRLQSSLRSRAARSRCSISPPRDLGFDPPISLSDFDFCCCCVVVW